MNPKKAMLTHAVVSDIGAQADDVFEAAEKAVLIASGKQAGIKLVSEKLNGIFAHVNRDLDEGLLTPEELAVAKRYLQKAVGMVVHLHDIAVRETYDRQGRATQAKTFVDMLAKRRDAEEQKLRSWNEAVAHGDITVEEDGTTVAANTNGRLAGAHPGASIAAQRKAEAIEAPPQEEPEKKTAPKKRLRSPKQKKKE